MNRNTVLRTSMAASVAAALLMTWSVDKVLAATAAGTQIKNLATVTYEDAAGNEHQSQSNEAVVTVAQVYSATISTDISLNASPGQPVYLPYVLENTGNGTDTFSVSATNGFSGTDDLNASIITVYDDVNGNGQADAGEPVISGEFTLASSEIRNIVVEVLTPTTAVAGETLGVTLLAQAQQGSGSLQGNSVTDSSTGSGLDGLDGTVEAVISISADAVVVASKSSSYDAANNQISYTIQIRNNGNTVAKAVSLRDAIPQNTTYVADSAFASGLLVSNGDLLPAISATLDEAADGVDYNGDGDTLDSVVTGIEAIDSSLPPNAVVSITYTVSFDPSAIAGGTKISNTAYVVADLDDDGVADGVVKTNSVSDTVTIGHGVLIADTGEATGGDGVNDGRDDNTLNGVQFVDRALSGSTVIFKGVVTNMGNAADVLELAIVEPATLGFPEGTIFTLWDDTGLVQLTDSNSLHGIDVGLVEPAESVTFTVKAVLPSGVSDASGFNANVVVSSANDLSRSASLTLSLGEIGVGVVDIHHANNGTVGTDEDPLGSPEYNAVNTHELEVGSSVNIPLFIDNESAVATSYQIAAGGSFDPAANLLGSLPDGWTVEFYLADATGAPTGDAVTSTAPLDPGSTNFPIVAVVTAPSDRLLALFDSATDNDADGTEEILDGNADGDGDYAIFFSVTSVGTGASDVTLEAIDVNVVHAVSLTPSGSRQVEAGGSVVYQHTLANNGNAEEVLQLTTENTQPGWSSTVAIDIDGDGAADTELGNLVAGNISVAQPDGSVVTMVVTIDATTGAPSIAIPPGAVVRLSATVFAPSSSTGGDVDTLTITAISVTTDEEIRAQDQSQIVAGKLFVVKTVAIDSDCDSQPDTVFVQTQTERVEPGQCVIWQVVTQNQGTADAFNVKVTDAVPAFTSFEAASLRYCVNTGCIPAVVTDVSADDAGEESNGNLYFYVGSGAVPASAEGGVLVAGDEATVRFTVRVD